MLRRWSSNILCGLSLLIFLLAMGIWVRSYFAGDVVRYVPALWSQTAEPLHVRQTVDEVSTTRALRQR